MGLICLVEEPGGWETVVFWKTLPERFSKFWKVCFTAFDRDMICSTSPGICKGSQASPSSRASYLKPVRVLEGICLKQCPLTTYYFPAMSCLCQLLVFLMLLLHLCGMMTEHAIL